MGKKKLKNDPYIWDEVKKSLHLSLTLTAIDGLQALANEKNLSRSELVERIGRGIITLNSQ
jgi:predicted transcriptional regulator